MVSMVTGSYHPLAHHLEVERCVLCWSPTEFCHEYMSVHGEVFAVLWVHDIHSSSLRVDKVGGCEVLLFIVAS